MHTRNILNLFKEKLYIIYASHSEDMCAKYGRSRMNDAHTISLADSVGLPTKVTWPIALFSDSESILYDFCVGHWPVGLGLSTWIVAFILVQLQYLLIKV